MLGSLVICCFGDAVDHSRNPGTFWAWTYICGVVLLGSWIDWRQGTSEWKAQQPPHFTQLSPHIIAWNTASRGARCEGLDRGSSFLSDTELGSKSCVKWCQWNAAAEPAVSNGHFSGTGAITRRAFGARCVSEHYTDLNSSSADDTGPAGNVRPLPIAASVARGSPVFGLALTASR